MIRCDKCTQPCDTETHYSEERHGFSFGPYEQWADERSECCGAEVYDDGKSNPDEDEDDREAPPAGFAADLFAMGVELAKGYLPERK